MAPITTHLVIGERVYPNFIDEFGPLDYGSFLLGNVLVDAHGFSEIDRRTTHFADRLDKIGSYAFDRSCQNYMERLSELLLYPLGEFSNPERAFVIGYLCHLAADENWKKFDWDVLENQEINLWTDLTVPGDVLLTVFDVLSNPYFFDHPAVSSALQNTPVPNVFSHVSCQTFQSVWDIIRNHVEQNSSLESFLEIQKQLGTNCEELEIIRKQHETNWKNAINIIDRYFGGVESRVDSMVQQTLKTVIQTYGSAFTA